MKAARAGHYNTVQFLISRGKGILVQKFQEISAIRYLALISIHNLLFGIIITNNFVEMSFMVMLEVNKKIMPLV